MSKPSDVVNIALAEVGYREKASNASLDDKTANAGAANWTKYARDLAAAGYYNGNKNGYAWCDVFVDWCFFKAYGSVEGQRIQCQTGPLGAGCIFSAQYYQQKGRYDRTPKVGDQVFFQSGGEIGHTGIVFHIVRQLHNGSFHRRIFCGQSPTALLMHISWQPPVALEDKSVQHTCSRVFHYTSAVQKLLPSCPKKLTTTCSPQFAPCFFGNAP